MGVFTDVSDDMAAELLSNYDIGALERLIPIMQGVENSNFHLFTDAGRYILTVFEGRTETTALPFYFAAMDHLRAKGVTCPQVLRDRKDETLQRVAGKPAAILSFLSGRGVSEPDITPALCGQMGILLARMHIAGLGFAAERTNTVSLPYWQAMAQKCQTRADEVEPGLASLLQDEMTHLAAGWDTVAALPRGLVHADLFPDNVFIDDEKQICGVIDFYFACTDALVYDLAITANAWCFDADDEFDGTRFAALMAGYRSQRALSSDEMRLFSFVARAASVRFLVSRLHDYVFRPAGALVTPKDPREYSSRLRFHRDHPDLLGAVVL